MPVVVYEPFPEAIRHGNFLDAAYAAILGHPEWSRCLEKIHSQAARSLPRTERSWRELDSSMSSDALLTWQELSAALRSDLRQFLDFKYGIVPTVCRPSQLATLDL